MHFIDAKENIYSVLKRAELEFLTEIYVNLISCFGVLIQSDKKQLLKEMFYTNCN